jgi:hypothetical protein
MDQKVKRYDVEVVVISDPMLIGSLNRFINPLWEHKLLLQLLQPRRFMLQHLAPNQVLKLQQIVKGLLFHYVVPLRVDEMIGYNVEIWSHENQHWDSK